MLDALNVYCICVSGIACTALNVKLANHYRPRLIAGDRYLMWKWRNTFASIVHSAVVGVGVLYTLISDDSLASNMIGSYSTVGNAFVCVSSGYFIYDAILSLINLQYPGRIEIIAHHFVSLTCLLLSMWLNRFLGYCVLGLTVEINNVFIHVRQMLLLAGISETNKIFWINSCVIVYSVLQFRFVPLTWIAYCLYIDRHYIEVPLFVMAYICLTAIFIVSCVLLFRVITTDFNLNGALRVIRLIGATSAKFHYECSTKLRKML